MSLRSNTDLAVRRDTTPAGDTVRSNDPTREYERTQDALISAIPSEILVLYTTLTSGALALIVERDPTSYLPYRWALLGFAVLLTPVSVLVIYRRKNEAVPEKAR